MQVGEKRNTLPNAEYGITYLHFWKTYLTTGPIYYDIIKKNSRTAHWSVTDMVTPTPARILHSESWVIKRITSTSRSPHWLLPPTSGAPLLN